jgi:DNA-directed RNA polymerase subunit RPC12/RpoP
MTNINLAKVNGEICPNCDNRLLEPLLDMQKKEVGIGCMWCNYRIVDFRLTAKYRKDISKVNEKYMP